MATVDRVLRWRRHTTAPMLPVTDVIDELTPVLEEFRAHHPGADERRIVAAYERAHLAHHDQVRRSGDPYIRHPLAVATILAGIGLDDVTLAAALLHDAVEDTG